MRVLFSTIIIVLCSVAQLNAQSLVLNTINSDSESTSKAFDNKTIYQLNSSIFENGLIKDGSNIQIALPSAVHELEVTRVTEFVPGIKSYRAISNDGQIFSFTYQNGALNGVYHESLTHTKLFKVSKATKEHIIIDSEHEVHNCSMIDEQNIINGFPKQAKSSLSDDTDEFVRLPGNDLEEQTTIDLMIAYTQASEDWATSEESGFEDIDGVLAQSMNLLQTVFDNSDIPITFRLVYSHKVNYDESSVELNGNGNNNENILFDFVGDESWSPGKDGGDTEMNEVHDLRNQYGADLMILFVSDMIGAGGTAFSGPGYYGDERGAFNINIIRQVVDDSYTLVHEIGHNLSIDHSRTQESSPASIYGGSYSNAVGYQDAQNGFATIMGYRQQDIPIRVPYFSDPNNSYEGAILGIDDPEIPANATHAIKSVKHLVASYRPTIVAPPVPMVTAAPIIVDLGANEIMEIPFNIQNTGESDLSYSIDFELIQDDILAKQSTKTYSNFDDIEGDTLLFSGFENEEGFPIKSFTSRFDWKAGNSLTPEELEVTNEAPRNGSQNLRFYDNINSFLSEFYSPFLGQLEFGTYKISLSIKIADVTDVRFTRYEINVYDAKQPSDLFTFIDRKIATISSRLGDVYISGFNTDRKVDFATTAGITFGEYADFEIIINSDEQKLSYYLNGEPIINAFTLEPFVQDLVGDELVPGYIEIYRSNNIEGGYMDIDDISIIRYNSPYSWLTIQNNNKTIKPNDSDAAQLTFSSGDLAPGVYTANMIVTTNNDGDNSFNVPITLNIASNVSSEDNQLVDTFILDQNYPNPFNPSTNISFTLPDVSEVNLQVYDMLGRSVATLVDGRLNAGKHNISFDASSFASGMYVYTIKAENYTSTKRMVLIK